MSKPRRVPDYERTATMLDLVRRQYFDLGGPHPDSPGMAHVVIEEVAPGTGWSGTSRWADVLALAVWPSKGLTLDGYEIKASRADLRRELENLEKHRAVARYCDNWWLVAWDEKVLETGREIPDEWGIMITVSEDWDERALKVLKKPIARTPDPWPRSFTCSLVRNAAQQSPGAAFVARACIAAADKGRSEGIKVEQSRFRVGLSPLLAALYGMNSWEWPADARDTEKVLKLAAERLTQGSLNLKVPA